MDENLTKVSDLQADEFRKRYAGFGDPSGDLISRDEIGPAVRVMVSVCNVRKEIPAHTIMLFILMTLVKKVDGQSPTQVFQIELKNAGAGSSSDTWMPIIAVLLALILVALVANGTGTSIDKLWKLFLWKIGCCSRNPTVIVASGKGTSKGSRSSGPNGGPPTIPRNNYEGARRKTTHRKLECSELRTGSDAPQSRVCHQLSFRLSNAHIDQ